jgi:hypothetical protein
MKPNQLLPIQTIVLKTQSHKKKVNSLTVKRKAIEQKTQSHQMILNRAVINKAMATKI